MARATPTDLTYALGDSETVIQLLDKDQDNVADAGYVSWLLENACAEIDGRIRRHVPPESLTTPYPVNLVMHEAAIAAYLAYRFSTSGRAMPDGVDRGYKDAIAWADSVGDGRNTLSGPVEAPHQISDALVDIDPCSRRINRRTMRGFC